MVIFQYNVYIFGIHLWTVLYPKLCYNKPFYKEVEVYVCGKLFFQIPLTHISCKQCPVKTDPSVQMPSLNWSFAVCMCSKVYFLNLWSNILQTNVSGLFGDLNGNLMLSNGSVVYLNDLKPNTRLYNNFQLSCKFLSFLIIVLWLICLHFWKPDQIMQIKMG